MARITRDRENLLLEATALVPRVMLAMDIRGQRCEVFAGLRGNSLSIYFGASPVYHFNAAGELRRAYVDECLIKAESGQLIGSIRQRSAEQVVLASKLLSVEETDRFLTELADRLADLRDNLNRSAVEVIGQVPHDGDAIGRLQAWLANWSGPRIAAAANVS